MQNLFDKSIKEVPMPNFLYKYYPECEWLFPVPTLRYTPVNELNDPYEFQPIIKKDYHSKDIKQKIKKFGIKRINNKKLKKFARKINVALLEQGSKVFDNICKKNDIGILSLTEICNSTVMWALYASNHKGLVFKYDMNHEIFQPRKGFSNFYKVGYSQKRLELGRENGGAKEVFQWIFTKSTEWSFEKEWRSFTNITSSMCASDAVSGTFKIPVNAISSIYFGLKTDGKFLEMAKDFCNQNHINMGRMKLHKTNFNLEIQEMTI